MKQLFMTFLISSGLLACNSGSNVTSATNLSKVSTLAKSTYSQTDDEILNCTNRTAMIDEHDYASWKNYTDIWNVFNQNGYLDTGNHELANFDPANVSIDETNGLVLTLEGSNQKYKSGKVALKKSITDYAPEHGYFVATITLPKTISYNGNSNSNYQYVQGYWPLLWLLPTPELAPGQNKWANSGEIDLLEMMEQENTSSQLPISNSTLHFGPVGGDAWYEENGLKHWGYQIGTNSWDNYNAPQKIIFEWNHVTENVNSYWVLTMYVNGNLEWTRNITRLDIPNSFENFEQNKNFYNWGFSETVPNSVFGPNGSGDPAFIFNRAFSGDPALSSDTPNKYQQYGLHLIFNFAFGGDPFYKGVDTAPKTAIMTMPKFSLYNCQ